MAKKRAARGQIQPFAGQTAPREESRNIEMAPKSSKKPEVAIASSPGISFFQIFVFFLATSALAIGISIIYGLIPIQQGEN